MQVTARRRNAAAGMQVECQTLGVGHSVLDSGQSDCHTILGGETAKLKTMVADPIFSHFLHKKVYFRRVFLKIDLDERSCSPILINTIVHVSAHVKAIWRTTH